jgi:hypothetical protein
MSGQWDGRRIMEWDSQGNLPGITAELADVLLNPSQGLALWGERVNTGGDVEPLRLRSCKPALATPASLASLLVKKPRANVTV